MKSTRRNFAHLISLLLAGGGFLLPPTVHAVEGGMGRSVSGAGISPYAGLIPPTPGFMFSLGEAYYKGDIGGNLATPIGANLALDLDLKVSFTNLSLLYIWDTPSKTWNFASAVAVPLAWLEATANVTLGSRTGQRKESEFGVFDLAFIPIIASHHFSETDHLALSFTVWAPTGKYDENDLANLSLNNWTFIPGVAYTKLFPKADIEISAMGSLQFYTENHDTQYQNGVMIDVEALAIKRFKCGAGIGVVGSWIDQLNDDSGPTADKLNGFNGRAFGVGPILTFSKAGSPFSASARWVHEFQNKNAIEGDVLTLSLGWTF